MLRFLPEYKAVPWGGRRLASELRRAVPEGPIGEAWELVELPEHHSRVRQGQHEGRLLGELWRAGKLGGSARGAFPFLLKWLDTADKLSVQVHPDEASCRKLGTGQPKTEAWYVARAEPGAGLWLGHHPGLDAATFKQAASGGTIQKWLFEVHPRAGQFLLVPAGTLHAIGGGFLLLEVQQPSDTTYRVYDWQRLGLDGQPRALHLEQASAAVHFERTEPLRPRKEEVHGPCFVMRKLAPGQVLPPTGLRVLVAELADVSLMTARGEQKLAPGEVVVCEPDDGEVTVSSGRCVLVSEAGG